MTGRHQFVSVNGLLSFICAVISGVTQGSVLGPLLFLILINDIDEDIKSSFLSSFADDTRVGMGVETLEDVEQMQNDLNKLYEWANRNNMELNSSKFELMCYGKNKFDKPYTYLTASGEQMVPSLDVKDLGVIMSSSCDFSSHIAKVVATAKRLMSWALRSFSARSAEFVLTIWKSIILPRIDYGSQLWNPFKKGDIQQLEILQKSFITKIASSQNLSYWDQACTS